MGSVPVGPSCESVVRWRQGRSESTESVREVSSCEPEKDRLRIGNRAKAVLVSGQAYQDPKDAPNKFVSNSADEYVEAGRRGERVRILLKRKGALPSHCN
jgi:hypothetical protein